MSDIWDPERIRIVGSVLERYSAHIAPGHRIRCGMEGDECAVYRSSTDAPCATVTEVFREPNGYVKFRAQMDGTGAIVDFDNRNIAPGAIWEIEPDYLETFRGHVERSMDGVGTNEIDDVERMFDQGAEKEEEEERKKEEEEEEEDTKDPMHRGVDEFERYRSTILSEMDERFRSQELMLRSEFGAKDNSQDEFRATMAETVRMLAGDLLRVSRGHPPQFAERYVDRYDLALTERSSPPPSPDPYRGSSKKKSSLQDEKLDFSMDDDVPAVRFGSDFAESEHLTVEED